MPNVRALIERSAEARRSGDRAAARKLANEAAEMSKASRDRHGLGAALAALGRLHRDDHDYDAALASYEEAAELARGAETSSRWRIVSVTSAISSWNGAN